MKTFASLIFILSVALAINAQPENNLCVNATEVEFEGELIECPIINSLYDSLEFSTIDATHTFYTNYLSSCALGGNDTYVGEEIWYKFTAISNRMEVIVSGYLAHPTIVLFKGSTCSSLQIISCSTSPFSFDYSWNLTLEEGEDYYMLLSNGIPNHMGIGNITFRAYNHCHYSLCSYVEGFEISPEAGPEGYAQGQVVSFCYEIIGNWSNGAEWLHSVEIIPGSGWLQNSITPVQFPQLDESSNCTGEWGWYDFWESCQTGEDFGPGFAYEFGSGNSCPGNWDTEDSPGDNFGVNTDCYPDFQEDGSLEFCWTARVKNCYAVGNEYGNLDMSVKIHSDGSSGGYIGPGCVTERNLYSGSILCCEGVLSDYQSQPPSCAYNCDGLLTINEVSLWGSMFKVEIRDTNLDLVKDTIINGLPASIEGLCEGDYTVFLASLDLNSCLTEEFTLYSGSDLSEAYITLLQPPCEGAPILLQGLSNLLGDVTYHWTGPNGYSASGQIIQDAYEEGEYTLVVMDENGCSVTPTSIQVVFPTNQLTLQPLGPTNICAGESVSLISYGSNNYTWSTGETEALITVFPDSTTTYSVSTFDYSNGCSFIREIEIVVEQEIPQVPIISSSGYVDSVVFYWQPPQDSTLNIIISSISGHTGIQTDSSFMIDNLMPGESVTIFFEILNDASCGSGIELSGTASLCDNWPSVFVQNPGQLCLGLDGEVNLDVILLDSVAGVGTWSGAGIVNAEEGLFSPDEAGVGIHSIQYEWSSDTCSSIGSTLIFVTENLEEPYIQCMSTDSSILFFWNEINGADNYEVEVLSGQTGVLDSTTYLVENLEFGEQVEIVVTALSPGACGTSSTALECQTYCPEMTIEFPEEISFCESDGEMQIPFELIGEATGGTFSWTGDCGINPQTGAIDTEICGSGTFEITVTYFLNNCVAQNSTEVTIYPQPIAVFELDSVTCIEEIVIVTFTGSPLDTAEFIWNFDGAVIHTGTGQGPFEISWPTGGQKEVTLQLVELGCPSEIVTQSIEVQTPATIEMTCIPSVESILFNWNAIPDVLEYNWIVSETGEQGVTQDTFLIVDGLSPEEMVTLELTAVSDICGEVGESLSCQTLPCPDVQISLTQIEPFCLFQSFEPLQLEAAVTGGAGTGILSWEGIGVIDASAGIFDPQVAGVGTFEITVTYTEGLCSYQSQMNIEIEGINTGLPEVLYACEGSNFEFCLPEGPEYSWTGPNGFSSQHQCLILPFFDGSMEGVYTVESDLDGECDLIGEVLLIMEPDNIQNLTSTEYEVCPHDVFELTVETSGTAVQWYPISNVLCDTCFTTMAFIDKPRDFYVQSFDESGCVWWDTIHITFHDLCAVEEDPEDPVFDLGENNSSGQPEAFFSEKEIVQEDSVDFTIRPNPVQQDLTIDLKGISEGDLMIFDVEGKIVRRIKVEGTSVIIDCSELSSGLYYCQLMTPAGNYFKRFVVAR